MELRRRDVNDRCIGDGLGKLGPRAEQWSDGAVGDQLGRGAGLRVWLYNINVDTVQT